MEMGIADVLRDLFVDAFLYLKYCAQDCALAISLKLSTSPQHRSSMNPILQMGKQRQLEGKYPA